MGTRMTKTLSAVLATIALTPFTAQADEMDGFSIEQYSNDLDLILPIIDGMQMACTNDESISCDTPDALLRILMQHASTNPTGKMLYPEGDKPINEVEQLFVDKVTEKYITPAL